MLVILKIKISQVSIQKFLYPCQSPYSRCISSYMVLHLRFLRLFNIYSFYLHVIGAYLKVIIIMFYFHHLVNSSNIMKNIFNSISIYSLISFLNIMKFRKIKTHQKIYFSLLSLGKTNR